LGFLIVILGKTQFCTENAVTLVAVTLTDPRTVPNRLGLWAAVVVYEHVLEPPRYPCARS
jgi:hypothetical protein